MDIEPGICRCSDLVVIQIQLLHLDSPYKYQYGHIAGEGIHPYGMEIFQLNSSYNLALLGFSDFWNHIDIIFLFEQLKI